MNQYQNSTASSKETNTMGLVGFIFSLVGFITCGALSPIALILSFIAIFKRPRGFAIAGLIISLLGSFMLYAVIMRGIVVYTAFSESWKMGVYELEQISAVIDAEDPIHDYLLENDTLPSSEEGQTLLENAGHNIRYEYDEIGDFSTLTHAGEDGIYDTEDDYVEIYEREDYLYDFDLDSDEMEDEATEIELDTNDTENLIPIKADDGNLGSPEENEEPTETDLPSE